MVAHQDRSRRRLIHRAPPSLRVGEGTGLGLSMMYGFARQSGGAIDIHSRVGEGIAGAREVVILIKPFSLEQMSAAIGAVLPAAAEIEAACT